MTSRPHETAVKHAMFKDGDYISITMNTRDSLQYFNFSTQRRLRYAVRVYYNIARLLTNIGTFELRPELSRGGRLHYHGTLKLYDSFEFHVHVIPILKEVCNLDLDTIDDMAVWKAYCAKDSGTMEPGLTKHALPYELRNDNLDIKKWNTHTITIKHKVSKDIKLQEHDYRQSILDWIEERDSD